MLSEHPHHGGRHTGQSPSGLLSTARTLFPSVPTPSPTTPPCLNRCFSLGFQCRKVPTRVATTRGHGTKLKADRGRTEPVLHWKQMTPDNPSQLGSSNQSSRIQRALTQQSSSCPGPPQLSLKRSLLWARHSEQTGKPVPWQSTNYTEPAWSSEQVKSTEVLCPFSEMSTPGPKSQHISQPEGLMDQGQGSPS